MNSLLRIEAEAERLLKAAEENALRYPETAHAYAHIASVYIQLYDARVS